MTALRTPPHALDAEQAVIGGLLLNNQAIDNLTVSLSAEDFYHPNHRILFEHIHKLISSEQVADVNTVGERLETAGEIQSIGGEAYLAELVQDCITANINRHAEVVHAHAMKRNLISLCSALAEDAYSYKGNDTQVLFDEASQKILALAESGRKASQSYVRLEQVLRSVWDKVEVLDEKSDHSFVTGIPTGFSDLDKSTSGLHPGDMVVVAGRPSMGKTAFAINIAENIALDSQLPVIVFSLEMSAAQIAARMISSVGRITIQNLRSGNLTGDAYERFVLSKDKLNEAPIYIDEAAGSSVLDLRTKARQIYKACHHQLGVIVIDYIQLMTSASKSANETRAAEVSEITRGIKALAKELNVPIIVLSQLNRSLEMRPDKRPVMADLRESGAIEQDADLIMFVYRDEHYHPDSKDKGMAEIIIGKQRNGPVGTVGLSFHGQYTKFENLDDGSEFQSSKVDRYGSDNKVDKKTPKVETRTFDHFVKGPCNALAKEAAMQVANMPGEVYNPLYFYGDHGLGKTHLLHAIKYSISQKVPALNVQYVHAEKFVADIIKAFERKEFDAFQKYYHSLDVLLLDDVQCLAQRQRSQEELFYMINAICEDNKQIVLTGDMPPSDLTGIDRRLINRIAGGLSLEIPQPEQETREAILFKKAKCMQIRLDKSVAAYVAKKVTCSARELEGLLNIMVAMSAFTGEPIDIALAKKAIKLE